MSVPPFTINVLLRSEQTDGQVGIMDNTVPAGWPGPARYLLVCTPAGFERYFDRLAAEKAGVEPPPEAAKPYPPTIMVGPRIGERAGQT